MSDLSCYTNSESLLFLGFSIEFFALYSVRIEVKTGANWMRLLQNLKGKVLFKAEKGTSYPA